MDDVFAWLLCTWRSLKWENLSLFFGIITGWLIFEITERRRVRLSQRELSRALLAELESAEVLASIAVTKYARICCNDNDVAAVAREIRWFLDVGRERFGQVGIVDDIPSLSENFKNLEDQELVAIYSSIKETIGTEMIFPILETTLQGQTSGFNADQIRSLSMVRWQSHLLNLDATSMKEFYFMSFTVQDENNHKIVLTNHAARTESYARRAQTLLRAIRAALTSMR